MGVRVWKTNALVSWSQQGSLDTEEIGGSELGPRTLSLLGRAWWQMRFSDSIMTSHNFPVCDKIPSDKCRHLDNSFGLQGMS